MLFLATMSNIVLRLFHIRFWAHLTIYGKGGTGNVPGYLLKALKEEFVDGEND